jgi:zinc finger protein
MPEFGIDVTPGPAAEAFISNVEGVLARTRPVVESAINFAETDEQRARGKDVLDMIDRALDGTFPFSLILEDPAGVSGILPDDLTLVKYEELSDEEASQLHGAPMWLDTAREEYKERKG